MIISFIKNLSIKLSPPYRVVVFVVILCTSYFVYAGSVNASVGNILSGSFSSGSYVLVVPDDTSWNVGVNTYACFTYQSSWLAASSSCSSWGSVYPAFSSGDPSFSMRAYYDNGLNYSLPGRFYVYWFDSRDSSLLADTYFDLSATGTPSGFSSITRIISLEPSDGAVISETGSTTLVRLGMHFYISPDDVGSYYSVSVNLFNWDRNTFPQQLSDFSVQILDNWTATTSGSFYAYRDVYLQSGGYKLEGTMKRSYLSGWIQNPFKYFDDKYSIFTVGQDTYLSSLAHVQDNLNTALGSYEATSTSAMSGFCVPWSGSFDTIGCVSFLFVPDQDQLSNTLKTFRDNVSNRFPLGYFTDFVSILSTSTSSSLPLIDAVVPPGIPGTGAHLTLSLDHSLDYVLYATTSHFMNVSAPSFGTLYDITSVYWNKVVYFLTILYILGRLLGSGLIPRFWSKAKSVGNMKI